MPTNRPFPRDALKKTVLKHTLRSQAFIAREVLPASVMTIQPRDKQPQLWSRYKKHCSRNSISKVSKLITRERISHGIGEEGARERSDVYHHFHVIAHCWEISSAAKLQRTNDRAEEEREREKAHGNFVAFYALTCVLSLHSLLIRKATFPGWTVFLSMRFEENLLS